MSQLANMMEQVRKLKNGVGVQTLLDAAYKILGNPIVLFDTNYRLITYTETVTDDPFWNEIITQGAFSKETLGIFGSEGFIEDVANNPSITVMSSNKIKYDRIGGKIFNQNNSFVSFLLIVACNKSFEKNDAMVFEAVCKLISKEINGIEFYQVQEQIHQESVIKKLIDGTYDINLDIAQVGILYDALQSNLYVAVAVLSQCVPGCDNIAYFRDQLKQAKPAYKYAAYDDRIVIIISTSNDELDVNKELGELIKLFEQNNMYAGLSSRFENLFELKKYYMEATESLEYVVNCKCNQRIFPYNPGSIDTLEQIESLENGSGIQYFLNKGLELFGNPILFHDMEPNLLGYTENVEIADPIWQELITYGTGSDETVALFRTEGWVDIMDKTGGGALLVSDKCKYDRISWRIYNSDNIRFGCTSIVNTMKPFSEDELVLFGTFSQKFSKEVKRIELYDSIGQVYSGTIINRLLSGKIDDYTFYSEDISNLYDHLLENIYVVVIDTTLGKAEQADLTYFRQLFNWPNAVNRFTIYDTHIIVIMSINDNNLVPLNESKQYKEISKVFEQCNFYAGISGRFENIYELQKHYMEAVSVLNAGIKNKERGSKQQIFQYDGTCHES